MITVLVVDDMTCVRQGLRMRLGLEPDLRIVGEAGNAREAVALASRLRPDVVLMDVEMPGMDGLAATATLAGIEGRPSIVTLSLHDDAETRARSLLAGACAFVAKHQPVELLLAAIREAARERGDQLRPAGSEPTWREPN